MTTVTVIGTSSTLLALRVAVTLMRLSWVAWPDDGSACANAGPASKVLETSAVQPTSTIRQAEVIGAADRAPP